MLDTAAQRFPEATALFNLLYGGWTVYMVDGTSELTVLQPEQGPLCGVRFSSAWGSQRLYPELAILSFVDDVIVLIPPPSEDTPAAWEVLFQRHAACLADLKRLAFEQAGLTLNLNKCGLLLPPKCPLPTPITRSLFPSGFDFQTDGFRVAGSPIGTSEFMAAFCEERLADAVEKLSAIKSLLTLG